MYSYTPGGLMTKKTLVPPNAVGTPLETVQTYDNEGKVQTVKYPDWQGGTGPTYTYSYDSAGRPNGLTDNSAVTWVQNVMYGAANEMTSMQYRSGVGYWTETRTYNERLQMARLRVQDNYSVWQTDFSRS